MWELFMSTNTYRYTAQTGSWKLTTSVSLRAYASSHAASLTFCKQSWVIWSWTREQDRLSHEECKQRKEVKHFVLLFDPLKSCSSSRTAATSELYSHFLFPPAQLGRMWDYSCFTQRKEDVMGEGTLDPSCFGHSLVLSDLGCFQLLLEN